MKRWPFGISTSLSIVMMISATVLWGYSYLYGARLLMSVGGGQGLYVQVLRGELSVHICRRFAPMFLDSTPVNDLGLRRISEQTKPAWHQRYGFGYHGARRGPFAPKCGLLVPLWFTFLASGILPGYALYKYIRYKRNPNACEQCGYDLSGTLAASRESCPECGHRTRLTVKQGTQNTVGKEGSSTAN